MKRSSIGRDSELRILIALLVVGALANFLSGCDSGRRPAPSSPGEAAIIAPETGEVATVNGFVIDSGRLNKIYGAAFDGARNGSRPLSLPMAINTKLAISKKLIDSELLLQHARKSGLALSQEELEEGVAEFAASFSSAEAYQRYVSRSALGERGVERLVRDRILSKKLVEIPDPDQISDEEAREYYDERQRQFNVPAHLVVREIVVSDDSTAREVTVALAAEELDFAQIARRFSEAKSARLGGHRGRTTEDNIEAAVWQVLQGMSDGDISGPVATANGVVFVERLASKPATVQSFEAARRKIKQNLSMRRHTTRYAELAQRLRREAEIENHIESRYGAFLDAGSLPIGQPALGSGHTATGELVKRDLAGGGSGS